MDDTVDHVKKELVSSSCNEMSTAYNLKKRHNPKSNIAGPYTCDGCGEAFLLEVNLNSHRQIHSTEKPYPCSQCSQSFLQWSHLNSHMRKHSGSKPYKCDQCGQSFSQVGTLQNHVRTHTKEKPHICEFCGRGFSQVSTMINHRRTHTGEKPFPCSECHKRFSQRSTLREHLKTHSGERPHQCIECGKRFTQLGTLKNHLRTHSKGARHKCNNCQQTFAKKRMLLTHVKNGSCALKKRLCQQIELMNSSNSTHEDQSLLQSTQYLSGSIASLHKNSFEQNINTKAPCNSTAMTKPYSEEHSLDDSNALLSSKEGEIAHYVDASCSRQTTALESIHSVRNLGLNLNLPEAKPYACGVCGSCFTSADTLESHIAVH